MLHSASPVRPTPPSLTSIAAYYPGEAGDEERRQRPAEHGREPGAGSPGMAQGRMRVRAPVVGLVDVDDGNYRVDGVTDRGEARVAARAPGR